METTSGRRILVAEDELEVRGYLEMALKYMGYLVVFAQDGEEALATLRSSRDGFNAVMLDIEMPNHDGLETLCEIRRVNPDLPVIIMSGDSSTLNIVSAMKVGATDFLSKPLAHEDLRKAVIHAVEREGPVQAPAPRPRTAVTNAFIGTNPRIMEIQSLVPQIGWSDAPVLIQGETGSGKEVLARELHAHSPRAHRPLLKLNCAALPSELVESELFGYERGAFTGAFQKKAGMFELADGGSILLDEIGDMDVRLQAKLLQVLQDQSFQRLGGKETVKVDVRVMAATHRDLEKAIVEGKFREDLYYRVNVISLQLPALRERKEDIVPLTEFLLNKHAVKGVAPPPLTLELRNALMRHPWPGNVRQLENCVRRLLILRDPDLLARELHMNTAPRPLAAPTRIQPVERVDTPPILEQVTRAKHQAETEAILAALNSTRWNRKQAASLLQIDYKALLYKMGKLGIDDKTVPITTSASLPPKFSMQNGD